MNNVQDIAEEIISYGTDLEIEKPDYEVVAVVNVDEVDEQRLGIQELRWDHDNHQLMLVL